MLASSIWPAASKGATAIGMTPLSSGVMADSRSSMARRRPGYNRRGSRSRGHRAPAAGLREEAPMPLPTVLDAIWRELEASRAEVLREADGLTQAQADWRASPADWSVGEILHHLTLAEVATGKLTSKLLRETGAAARPFPGDLAAFAPLPLWPAGPREAPPVVRPEPGHPIEALLRDMRATRERSRQSLERLAGVDPRALTWRHFALGELDLGQWWMLQAQHDRDHLQQLRRVKAAPGFPRA
jgi:hypothetical protein